ncbi:hypothetical protein EYF80_031259 [Liparis tanakae]|uniref:Uncharacterized protein n=1 Tax=Liparis tanakae TaxID=230148 RepID=A0A4Z2GY07_9TELE|nr:hypothetical protein EYF80_031259 [Liparis tanakae]
MKATFGRVLPGRRGSAICRKMGGSRCSSQMVPGGETEKVAGPGMPLKNALACVGFRLLYIQLRAFLCPANDKPDRAQCFPYHYKRVAAPADLRRRL